MNENIDVKISIEEYEVVSSGIINLFSKEFKIYINGITLIFEFLKDDDENAVAHFMGNTEGENTLRLKIFNMKNALVEGFYKPTRIGIVNGKEFFINFSAWSLDVQNNIRSLAYNLILGKEVSDGE